MSDKFPVGSRVGWPIEGKIEEGTVVENYKMPGDICIEWDMGINSSYDAEFLAENGVTVLVTLTYQQY